MILTDLKIHHVRTVSAAHLSLNSRFNFIIGANGSGKTSILEALYLLSCGHSFRSREISPVITHDQKRLAVFARAEDDTTISIQKSSSEPTQIKLNNQFCSTTSQLAYALPCQIIYSDLFQIMDAGPSVRRSVLDWGLFHVKPDYLFLWKEYRKVLKQRNALLKKPAPYAHFVPWDKQLTQLANQLDALRNDYFIQWKELFYQLLPQLTDCSCTIQYYKGWDKKNSNKGLDEILEDSFSSDKQKQYTQYGAHQADIYIDSTAIKAKQILSRGQQKIILIALKLAQGEMINKDCLYLFDDLAAELDDRHQKKLLTYLATHRGQYVITSIDQVDVNTFISPKQVSCYTIDAGSLTVI